MSAFRGIWKCIVAEAEPLQRSSQCLAVVDNIAYIFGGELQPRTPRDNAVYAVSLDGSQAGSINTFQAPDAPTPRVGAASATLGSALYVFGGRGGTSMACLESQGAFNVFRANATTHWSMSSPTNNSAAVTYPEDRSYHSMTSDDRNTIYVHAGCPAKGRLNDLWAFNALSHFWTQLPCAPGGGRGGTSIACSSTGDLYRVNGFDGKTEQGGTIDVYSTAQNAWSSMEYNPDGVEGPEPRSVAALVPIMTASGDELLVTMFGEGHPSDLGHAGAGRMFGDVWAWDISRRRWHHINCEDNKDVPVPRGWFDAAVWTGAGGKEDSVIVHGGLDESNSRLGDLWALHITEVETSN